MTPGPEGAPGPAGGEKERESRAGWLMVAAVAFLCAPVLFYIVRQATRGAGDEGLSAGFDLKGGGAPPPAVQPAPAPAPAPAGAPESESPLERAPAAPSGETRRVGPSGWEAADPPRESRAEPAKPAPAGPGLGDYWQLWATNWHVRRPPVAYSQTSEKSSQWKQWAGSKLNVEEPKSTVWAREKARRRMRVKTRWEGRDGRLKEVEVELILRERVELLYDRDLTPKCGQEARSAPARGASPGASMLEVTPTEAKESAHLGEKAVSFACHALCYDDSHRHGPIHMFSTTGAVEIGDKDEGYAVTSRGTFVLTAFVEISFRKPETGELVRYPELKVPPIAEVTPDVTVLSMMARSLKPMGTATDLAPGEGEKAAEPRLAPLLR